MTLTIDRRLTLQKVKFISIYLQKNNLLERKNKQIILLKLKTLWQKFTYTNVVKV